MFSALDNSALLITNSEHLIICFFNLILWHKETLVGSLMSLYFQCMPKPILADDQAWQNNTHDQVNSFCGVITAHTGEHH